MHLHLARLAARILEAPLAVIAAQRPGRGSLEFTTATIGSEATHSNGLLNTRAICEHIVRSGEPLLIENLRDSSGQIANGAETQARSYAAVPIELTPGSPIGALCVVDARPREWSADEISRLRQIAETIAGLQGVGRDQPDTALRQSIRLDAVGRLAGGIAHDFNNILTAIGGHVDLLLDETDEADSRLNDLEEIRRSTDRAARLTQQLLAFSRKQILLPKPIDPAEFLRDWAEELRQDLGSEVDLRLSIEPSISRIMADRSQLEVALTSVATNAMDASPDRATITVQAGDLTIDEKFAEEFPYHVEPGRYVRIAVGDEGHGMAPETLEKIFEPFFTTRPISESAGLGLSTVYGIVKQSDGYIWVDSRVGKGTTVEILLPAIPRPVIIEETPEDPESESATETILLFDDEAVIRNLVHRILSRDGFEILEASDHEGALRLAREHPDEIHLLLAGHARSGGGGRALSEQISEIRPGIRTLFISDYSGAEARRLSGIGAKEDEDAWIQKPFTPDALAAKVRSLLR